MGCECSATELGGGVSNTVLLVEVPGQRFILKQSLPRLRVGDEWLSERSRIFREVAGMRCLAGTIPVPEILYEDRENYCFAMTAAPPASQTWKTQLLGGEIDPGIAGQVGRALGAMICSSWNSRERESEFGDQTVFDQLRIDPYYRTAARRNPDVADLITALISRSEERRVALVHGDWSPKNFLISDDGLLVIDFEVIHFGDPSFDAAFLLNHLLLKSEYLPQWRGRFHAAALAFWQALCANVPPDAGWFEKATLEHLGALLLARIDGKSPAEYITDGTLKARLRERAYALLKTPPSSVPAVFA